MNRTNKKQFKLILLVAILLIVIAVGMLFTTVTYAAAAEDKKVIVVLGDSIAAGYSAGSTAQERAEKGYAGLVGKEKNLEIKNIAVGGWRTEQVINQLETSETAKEAVRTADYIQIAIGGNDLQQPGQVGPAITALLEDDESIWEQHAANIAERFAKIVDLVRGLNPNAPFFVFNSYTPDYKRMGNTNIASTLGLGAPASITGNQLYALAQDYAIPYFNSTYTAYLEKHPNAFIVVDIFDAFYENNSIFYGTATDVIHPSAVGHVRLADILVKAIDAYEYAKLVNETNKIISNKDAIVANKDAAITQKDSELSAKNSELSAKNNEINELAINFSDSEEYGKLMTGIAITVAVLLVAGIACTIYFVKRKNKLR